MSQDLQGAIGYALIILAVLSPLAYCSAVVDSTRERERNALQLACIQAKGEWAFGWGPPYCKLPETKP